MSTDKNNSTNANFARIAQPDGTRTQSSSLLGPPFYFPDNGLEPLCDDNGRLIVRVAGPSGYVDQVTNSDFNSEDIEVEFLQAGVTRFFGVSGTNNSGSDMYFQIFDKGSAPVNNDIPIRSYIVPAGSNYSISPFVAPQQLNNGLGIAWSSTPNILTLPGVDIGTAYLEWQG